MGQRRHFSPFTPLYDLLNWTPLNELLTWAGGLLRFVWDILGLMLEFGAPELWWL